ncbi:hypothetical protein QBC43DRAFT_61726 [Cladorrhinum sp. PSN259]|nr:hypothetical protein QBC43DRAFT_61726 [Cladorrhinum sp. PSN259]
MFFPFHHLSSKVQYIIQRPSAIIGHHRFIRVLSCIAGHSFFLRKQPAVPFFGQGNKFSSPSVYRSQTTTWEVRGAGRTLQSPFPTLFVFSGAVRKATGTTTGILISRAPNRKEKIASQARDLCSFLDKTNNPNRDRSHPTGSRLLSTQTSFTHLRIWATRWVRLRDRALSGSLHNSPPVLPHSFPEARFLTLYVVTPETGQARSNSIPLSNQHKRPKRTVFSVPVLTSAPRQIYKGRLTRGSWPTHLGSLNSSTHHPTNQPLSSPSLPTYILSQYFTPKGTSQGSSKPYSRCYPLGHTQPCGSCPP